VVAAPRKASAVRQPAGMDSLAEAVADLAVIAAELRQVTDDLRDLMSESEPEVGELIIAEVENPENLEEET
jgi:fumarate hydratase class II